MFKFLMLANALVAIVKMVSPTEPERVYILLFLGIIVHSYIFFSKYCLKSYFIKIYPWPQILDHCYTDRKSCLKECKECITDGRVCKANSIFDQKFLSNKNLVTCRNAMDQMIAWKKNTRPSSMLCFNYCNGKFEGCWQYSGW